MFKKYEISVESSEKSSDTILPSDWSAHILGSWDRVKITDTMSPTKPLQRTEIIQTFLTFDVIFYYPTQHRLR